MPYNKRIHVTVVMRPTEKEIVEEAAKRAGQARSVWAKKHLLRAAELERLSLPLSAVASSSGGVLLESKELLAEALAGSPVGAVIVDPRGVCMVGETPQGERAILVVDSEAGILGIVTPGSEAQESINTTRLAEFSEALGGAIAKARQAAIAGDKTEICEPWGRVQLYPVGPNSPRLSLNGVDILFSEVQLLQLQTEVCGLLVREVNRSLTQRRSLEALLSSEVKTHA